MENYGSQRSFSAIDSETAVVVLVFSATLHCATPPTGVYVLSTVLLILCLAKTKPLQGRKIATEFLTRLTTSVPDQLVEQKK